MGHVIAHSSHEFAPAVSVIGEMSASLLNTELEEVCLTYPSRATAVGAHQLLKSNKVWRIYLSNKDGMIMHSVGSESTFVKFESRPSLSPIGAVLDSSLSP